MTRKLIIIFFAALFVAMCLVMSGVYYGYRWLHQPVSTPVNNQQFVVQEGDSLYSVAHRLSSSGMLRWPFLWRQYARYFDPAPIKVGEYQLSDVESPVSLLDLMQSGKVITYSVTLVEGQTFKDFVATLAQQPKLKHLLAGVEFGQILDALGIALDHPEGWFYPDTYQFVAKDSDVSILNRAHLKMQKVLSEEWAARKKDLPYETPYEALIMASIVEKETGVVSERKEIASVFVRRLELGMRLQTDPTVIYGIGEDYDGNITRSHLRQHTPYNTYRIKGLPPTPIAMPGRAAINAALSPGQSKALYFVARGDGTHQFSETLEEHNLAVQRYQKHKRVENYRSAPPAPTAQSERK